jgi:hypothetical protein
MTYEIKANGIVIGTSTLDSGDPSMGIRHGIFVPLEAYSELKPAFDEYYKAIAQMTGNPGVMISDYKSASERISDFGLTLFAGNNAVPVENIEITDCSTEPELSSEPIEVSVVVKNSEIYEQVFGS